MPHVNPILPNQGETADAEDVSVPLSQLLAIFNGHIGPDNIEPNSMPWSVMGNFTDSIPSSAMRDSANLELFRKDVFSDFIAEGCIWSALTGLNGAMTLGVAYVGGVRRKINAIATNAFKASKDTYVSLSDSGFIGYTAVNNSAAAPTLPSNSIWVAIVITSASAVTKIIQNNAVDSNGKTIYRSGPINSKSQGDTGWIVPSFQNGYSATGGTTVEYRRIGDVLYLRGQVGKATMDSNHILRLPVGYRPATTKIFTVPGSGSNYAKLIINSDGEVYQVSLTGGVYIGLDAASFVMN